MNKTIAIWKVAAVIPLSLLISAILTLAPGCRLLSPITPGNDPLVVRAEQVQAGAIASFDLVLNVDQANRGFWRTNAPGFHQFCEWLRAPQVVNITNTAPRGVALVLSLQQVKADYKAARASSNLLAVAMGTLSSAVNQAQAWLTIVTNTPTP